MKEILYSLFFFPMPFIWLMLILILTGSKEQVIYFFKLIFITLLIFSLPLFNFILQYPLKSQAKVYTGEEKISFVLVPTAGIFSDSSNIWHGSKETIMRTTLGYKFSKDHGVPLLISGGKTIQNAPSEAFVAAKYLSLTESIILDKKSKNSIQTAQNLKNIIKSNNLDKGIIALATSSAHNLRMNLVLRSNGFNVRNISNDKLKNNFFSQIIPHTDSFAVLNSSLYEYLAIIKYILLGYIDLKIVYK